MMNKKVLMTTVKTSTEVDVKEIIVREVEKAVQAKIDELSTTYFRTISVDVKVEVE